jgi:hypothetical protein
VSPAHLPVQAPDVPVIDEDNPSGGNSGSSTVLVGEVGFKGRLPGLLQLLSLYSNTVSVIDTASNAVTATIHVGVYHRRGRTLAALLLAEVHIQAGEPRGLTLARQAIEEVSTLHSLAARRERLVPLTTALEARPSSDTRELARMARQVAASRI